MSKSVRIDDDVLERIISDVPGKSLSDKLRGLMESKQPSATGSDSPAALETLELVQTMAEQVEIVYEAVIARKQAIARAPLTPSNTNHCAHCDRDFPRPSGQPPTSMCPPCRSAGHWNTGSCRPCAEAKHLAGVAALDQTGSGRDDIEYDAQA